MDIGFRLSEARKKFFEAAVFGQSAQAHSIIDQALSRGVSLSDIYLNILQPSQIRIGEQWVNGVINIAQEHVATSITLEAMALLRQKVQPPAPLGLRAIVTPLEGDQHSIGARFVADFLIMDGWDVDFLGNATPARDLGEYVAFRSGDVVLLSSTLPEFLPNAKAAVESIRAFDPPGPKIILGGRSLLLAMPNADSIGCDALAISVFNAVQHARRLVGLSARKLSLQQHLGFLGRRIKAIRTSQKITQQELGDLSGLDRTYISSIEHGRQNLTIGAVLKISIALDVPIDHLLSATS